MKPLIKNVGELLHISFKSGDLQILKYDSPVKIDTLLPEIIVLIHIRTPFNFSKIEDRNLVIHFEGHELLFDSILKHSEELINFYMKSL